MTLNTTNTSTNPRPDGWHPLAQAGDWHLERSIIDRRAGIDGVLKGICRITQEDGQQLLLREEGELVFGTHSGSAWREYKIRLGPDGLIQVFFTDGRAFFALDSRTQGTDPLSINHICGDDLYIGQLTIISAQQWTLAWRIEGPRKQLQISSVYRAIEQAKD
ncbi:MAG: hypothetical protein KI792_03240 [Alphaproteobacteria bacterium]|nr:hypothetical protein [Alphaproteobacteria bacterium SS10]